MRGGNTFGGKPEKQQKSPGKPEKRRKFGRKPENAILESRKIEKKSAENSYFCGGNPERDPLLPPLLNPWSDGGGGGLKLSMKLQWTYGPTSFKDGVISTVNQQMFARY